MLHEVLLALSGHPSPLFESNQVNDFPTATAAENALLELLGHLSRLHRQLREHLAVVSTGHPSVICRATAASILRDHLSEFQKHIVEVERNILLKESSSVGAYDIVPLSSVVNEFKPWRRRLNWYWELACFMQPEGEEPIKVGSAAPTASQGVRLIDRLRMDARTGFNDIETAALRLSSVAEKAWLRLLVQWLVSGSLPQHSASDLFIVSEAENSFRGASVVRDRMPRFLTEETAHSILFVGKTIAMTSSDTDNTVQLRSATDKASAGELLKPAESSPVRAAFVEGLSRLQLPMRGSQLSDVVAQSRAMLAQKVIDKILPAHQLMHFLDMLRQFFLAGRGDFTDALIQQADSFIANRHQQLQAGGKTLIPSSLAGVMIKEGEVKAVLSRTFSALAPFISKDSLADEALDWARDHTTLRTARARATKTLSSGGVDLHFKDYLLLTPVELSVRLESSYELFLGSDELECYSAIQAYLLAIRRGHNHLTELWRMSSFRRDIPAPIRVRREKGEQAFNRLKVKRQSLINRMRALRKVWSSCSAAAGQLAELGAFLSNETIEGSWAAFRRWATQDDEIGKHTTGAVPGSHDSLMTSPSSYRLPHDPETLAHGHKQYVRSLVETLLLSDQSFTKALRVLLGQIDQIVAVMQRLQTVQRNVDLQEEGVFEDRGISYIQEEKLVMHELDKGGQALDKAMLLLIERLRRVSSNARQRPTHSSSTTGFQPFNNAAGVDRLLIRLDFSMGTEQDEDG